MFKLYEKWTVGGWGGGRNFPPFSTPLGVGDLKLWPGVDYEWFIKDASTPIYTC